jgi:dihydrolipoyl dehydrogenase
MKTRRVDVAVIGAGSAGMRAFRAASKWTDSVVLIEGGEYGTTCARVGCMPSKLLIAAADAAHNVQQAHEFGIRVNKATIDGYDVMDRVRRERDRFVGFVVDSVHRIPDAQRIRGYARFLDSRRLQVDDNLVVEADRIIIATGSTHHIPSFFNDLGDRLIVNDDVFQWHTLPRSVAVFGAGAIGLELGQALARLGVDVVLFSKGGNVGPLTDPRVVTAAEASFSDEFYFDSDADVRAVRRIDGAVAIDYVSRDGRNAVAFVDYVIAATGRTPNIANLDIGNAGIALDPRGVPLFDSTTMRAGDSSIFIAGDATSDRDLLHEASDEGQIAGDNAGRYPDVQPGLRRSALGIVFSDPQIAVVGTRHSELTAGDFVAGEVSFADQGRSRVMLKNKGLLRLYADSHSGKFIGAEMTGPSAEHLGHLLAWSHQSGLTVQQMLDMPFYHPVVEEGLRTALRDARSQLRPRLRSAA